MIIDTLHRVAPCDNKYYDHHCYDLMLPVKHWQKVLSNLVFYQWMNYEAIF